MLDGRVRNPIIVALDLPDADAALRLASEIHDCVGAFKVGKELFTAAGPDLVKRIRGTGGSGFFDLKFHDVPNTVAKAVASSVRLDVQMLTVHTSGGSEMMRAAVESSVETANRTGKNPPLVLGVTVLTSFDANGLAEIGVEGDVAKQVDRLARLAVNSGIGGLVCSPLEIAGLRQWLPREVQLVTPGIRPANSTKDDQKRTLSPREAIEAGANWLVIGRPIYAATNPRKAAEEILATIQ